MASPVDSSIVRSRRSPPPRGSILGSPPWFRLRRTVLPGGPRRVFRRGDAPGRSKPWLPVLRDRGPARSDAPERGEGSAAGVIPISSPPSAGWDARRQPSRDPRRSSDRRTDHGTDPQEMADGAAVFLDMGYEVIDVNLACPVKKIKQAARGGHFRPIRRRDRRPRRGSRWRATFR